EVAVNRPTSEYSSRWWLLRLASKYGDPSANSQRSSGDSVAELRHWPPPSPFAM
ncbi:hypothetical protein A2U01_0084949, partial [Trifolium medium]|nr:hypothetical protein [Trifolium medium]